MGQRLNISIRNGEEILASGYWHWGGWTDSALTILSEMTDMFKEFCESDNWRDWYNPIDLAVGFLQQCGCRALNDRNYGRMRIGRDQDTSEGNIIINLENKNIKLIDIFHKYGNSCENTVFEFKFSEANDYIQQIISSEDDFELEGIEYFKIS